MTMTGPSGWECSIIVVGRPRPHGSAAVSAITSARSRAVGGSVAEPLVMPIRRASLSPVRPGVRRSSSEKGSGGPPSAFGTGAARCTVGRDHSLVLCSTTEEKEEIGNASPIGCTRDVAVVTALERPLHSSPLPGSARRRRRTSLQGVVGFAVASSAAALCSAARDVGADESRLGWLASAFGIGLVIVGAVGLDSCVGARNSRSEQVLSCSPSVWLSWPSARHRLAVIGGFVSGIGAAALVLVTPVLLAGPDATTRYSRATAVASRRCWPLPSESST